MHRLWSIAVSLLVGCAQQPSACTTPGTCQAGFECLANRCMPVGGEPVPVATRRLVQRLTRAAWIGEQLAPGSALPPVVTLGASASGAAALLLSFERPAAAKNAVDSAFLLLPTASSAAPRSAVKLSIWRALTPWSDAEVSWERRPKLAGPELSVWTPRDALGALRLDVTELLRRELDGDAPQLRLAIVAPRGASFGTAFSTGTGAGPAPTLEVYVR